MVVWWTFLGQYSLDSIEFVFINKKNQMIGLDSKNERLESEFFLLLFVFLLKVRMSFWESLDRCENAWRTFIENSILKSSSRKELSFNGLSLTQKKKTKPLDKSKQRVGNSWFSQYHNKKKKFIFYKKRKIQKTKQIGGEKN